jgi:DNA-binding PadR family transcriptional regulator
MRSWRSSAVLLLLPALQAAQAGEAPVLKCTGRPLRQAIKNLEEIWSSRARFVAWEILKVLGRKEHASGAEIAEAAAGRLRQGGVYIQLQNMAAKGLVEQAPEGTSSTSRAFRLTEYGRRVLDFQNENPLLREVGVKAQVILLLIHERQVSDGQASYGTRISEDSDSFLPLGGVYNQLEQLEEKGLVSTFSDPGSESGPTHRRQVKLTEKGEEVVRALLRFL